MCLRQKIIVATFVVIYMHTDYVAFQQKFDPQTAVL